MDTYTACGRGYTDDKHMVYREYTVSKKGNYLSANDLCGVRHQQPQDALPGDCKSFLSKIKKQRPILTFSTMSKPPANGSALKWQAIYTQHVMLLQKALACNFLPSVPIAKNDSKISNEFRCIPVSKSPMNLLRPGRSKIAGWLHCLGFLRLIPTALCCTLSWGSMGWIWSQSIFCLVPTHLESTSSLKLQCLGFVFWLIQQKNSKGTVKIYWYKCLQRFWLLQLRYAGEAIEIHKAKGTFRK